jgi:polysaccharide export outer membrane protein
MKMMNAVRIVALGGILASGACSTYPEAPNVPLSAAERPSYVIGPNDQLSIFVWRNPELSMAIPVRPDGRISMPLVSDMAAAGKTPIQLAKEVEKALGEYIQGPLVTVIVTSFAGTFDQQVRVVGEAAEPKALQYRDDMTVLDAMIQAGGLTKFAGGNRAVLARRDADGTTRNYRVRLDDLIKAGDVSANVRLLPGDILIIPQSWF